MPGYTWY